MDADLYSDCLYSDAHTIILDYGRNGITPALSTREIFSRIEAIVEGYKEQQLKYVFVGEIFIVCPGLTLEIIEQHRKILTRSCAFYSNDQQITCVYDIRTQYARYYSVNSVSTSYMYHRLPLFLKRVMIKFPKKISI
jgi:hypothetical protein